MEPIQGGGSDVPIAKTLTEIAGAFATDAATGDIFLVSPENGAAGYLQAPVSYTGTYLSIPDDASLQKNDISFMITLKILEASGGYNDYIEYKYIAGSPFASWNLGSTSADKFYVSFAAGGYVPAVTGVIPYLQSLPATTTVNLIATYDSGTGVPKLYIDGGTPTVGSGGGSATIDYSYSGSGSGPQDMSLGRSHIYGNYNRCEYHDYAIWADKVLSPAEVATLQANPADSVAGLTHWWEFDGTFQATTGGLDGTISGSGWTYHADGSVVFTLENPTGLVANKSYTWVLTQPSLGSRPLALEAGTTWTFSGPTVGSVTANAVDIIEGIVSADGTTIHCKLHTDFI